MVLNQHKCRLKRLWASSHACYLLCTSNNECYNCAQITECWVLLHWVSGYVCSSYIQPMCMSVLLSPDQQPRHHCHRVSRHIYHCSCLIMFDYVALDQHTCLKPSSYVCISFMRLAGMLQYPYFKRCFEPTGMFCAIAPEHMARL